MFIDLKQASPEIKQQAAQILYEASKTVTADSWKTMDEAEKEVEECCQKNFIALGLMEDDDLAGWVGLRPMYDVTWELHPMMVRPSRQKQKIGSRLIMELERLAREKGLLGIILGTDDEFGKTSLSGVDLYKSDLFGEISRIENQDNHPFEFYLKNGYRIVGVVPDANGRNKPDIWMAKRISDEV